MARRSGFLYFVRYTGLTLSIIAQESDSHYGVVHEFKEGNGCNYRLFWALERLGV